MNYIAKTTVAYVLRAIEKDMLDMIAEGQFTTGDVKNVFAGWCAQLRISPADALPVDEKSFVPEGLTGV